MSSPPVKYLRYFDFTTFATNNPDKPLPGASVDVELNRLLITTNQTIDRLAEIQRDDGSFAAIIGTAQLIDKSVTEPKLADMAVSTRALGLAVVGYPQLQPAAVNSIILAPNSAGTVHLIDGGVTGPKIANGSIDNTKLANLAVSTGVLIDGCVTEPKLGALSVSTRTLQDLCCTTAKLVDAAVTSPKLGPSLNFTGVPTAPTAAVGVNTTQLATTAFVAASMSAAGAITEAPNDGKLYGRQALGWQLGVKLGGDTMTGPLVVPSLTATGAVNAASAALTGNLTAVDGTFSGALNSKSLGVRYDFDGPSASYHVNQSAGVTARSGWLAFNGTSYGGVLHYGANYNTVAGDSAKPNGTLITGSGVGGLNFEASAAGAGMEWWTNFTKRMTLDINGRIGVGVVPKTTWAANYRAVSLGPTGSLVAVDYGGGSNANIMLSNNAWYDGSTWRCVVNTLYALYAVADGEHIFYKPQGLAAAGAPINFLEGVRINSNGQLLIGTNAPPAWVDAGGGQCYAQRGFGMASAAVLQTDAVTYMQMVSSTRINMIVNTGGVALLANATAWSASSDDTLKTGYTPFVHPMAKLRTLKVGIGRFLTDAPEISRSFVSAQDVKAVLPEAVNVDPDTGKLWLRPTDLIPLMIAAMQKLDSRLAAGGL